MERKGLFGKENKGYSKVFYTALSNSIITGDNPKMRRNTQAQKEAYSLEEFEKAKEKVFTGGDNN